MCNLNLLKTLPLLAALLATPLLTSAHERFAREAAYQNHSSTHLERRHRYSGERSWRALGKIAVRRDRQWRRIEQGINAGELTRREVKKLRRQQRRIARLEYAFLDDDRLSRKERLVLMDRLDDASDRIYRFKHNAWRPIRYDEE